jgi:hypothetical protein
MTQLIPFSDDLQKMEIIDNPGRAQRASHEALPYSRIGHAGYQILWNPAVLAQLKEVA